MSIQAFSWALKQQRVRGCPARAVLKSLANCADAHGRNAFPGVEQIASEAGLTARSVQRLLRELLRAGVIRLGNQAIAAAYIRRADRRPTVYDLDMPKL